MHIAYLQPNERHLADASAGFLLKCLESYRETLSTAITVQNCDALWGTAILIHYLCWTNLDFLEGQNPDDPLDLSEDRLFILSRGIRDVHLAAWPMLHRPGGVWEKAGIFRPSSILEDAAEIAGLRWKGIRRVFMAAYDNPRYWGGQRSGRSRRGQQEKKSRSQQKATFISLDHPFLDYVNAGTPKMSSLRFEDVLPMLRSFNFDVLRVNDIATLTAMGQVPTLVDYADEKMITRAAFDRIATRVAVMLAFLREGRSIHTYPMPSARPGSGIMLNDTDVFTYAMSVAILCFGPAVRLVLSSDSRALILMYHFYHATNKLLQGTNMWWSMERSAILEVRMRNELSARGINVCIHGAERFVL